MNRTRINNISFRILGIAIIFFLIVGSAGILLQHLYIQGSIGMLAAIVIIRTLFQPASIRTWGLMIGVLVFAMFLVGVINSHETSIHI
jgi:hypothetical protein